MGRGLVWVVLTMVVVCGGLVTAGGWGFGWWW